MNWFIIGIILVVLLIVGGLFYSNRNTTTTPPPPEEEEEEEPTATIKNVKLSIRSDDSIKIEWDDDFDTEYTVWRRVPALTTSFTSIETTTNAYAYDPSENLQDNTIYDYYITNKDKTIYSDVASIDYKKNNQQVNEFVVGDDVSATTSQSITIVWDSVDGANKYEIYRDSVLIAQTPQTTFVDDDLQPNTLYRYQVKAFGANDNYSGLSNLLEVITLAKGPTVQFSSEDTSVILYIFSETYTTLPSFYEVYTLENNSTLTLIDTIPAEKTSGEKAIFIDENLTSDKEYVYYVRGIDVDSNILTDFTTVTVLTKLSPPVLEAIDRTETTITLEWTPVSGASVYRIYRKNIFIYESSSTLYTDIDLNSATSYSYYITAHSSDFSNLSPESNEVIEQTMLMPPNYEIVEVTANSIKINIFSTNNNKENYFNVLKGGTNTALAIIQVNPNGMGTFTQNNLIANTTYVYDIEGYTQSNANTSNPTSVEVTTLLQSPSISQLK
jgi:uncharacterized protein